MQLQRGLQIPPQGQFGGAGEEAGGAGDAGEDTQGARPARQMRVTALEPQIPGEGGGQQKARVLKPA